MPIPSIPPASQAVLSKFDMGYNVKRDGATGDGIVVQDATMTGRTGAGNVTVTSATANFLSLRDVGKLIGINGTATTVGYAATSGVIVSVESSVSITISVPGTVSAIASAGSCCFGTDQLAAVNRTIAKMTADGKPGDITFPTGVYCFSASPTTLTAGMNLVGSGRTGAQPFKYVTGGSVLVALPSSFQSSAFINMAGSGNQIRDITIDAAKRYNITVEGTTTQQGYINATIARGKTNTLHQTGGTCIITGCNVYGGFDGTTIDIGGDSQIYNSVIFGAGNTLFNIKANSPTDDCHINGNHIYRGGWGVTLSTCAGANVRFEQSSTSAVVGGGIQDNVFDTALGDHIEVVVFNTVATLNMESFKICGNQFYQPQSITDNTYYCIKVAVGAGSNTNPVAIKGMVISNNVGKCGSSYAYKGFINWVLEATYGTIKGAVVANNAINQCNLIHDGGYVPDVSVGNIVVNSSGTIIKEVSQGTATPTGTATTVFTIAHGLGQTPRAWAVTPGNTLSSALFYVTADGTNLTVTYASPLTGAISLNWEARF